MKKLFIIILFVTLPAIFDVYPARPQLLENQDTSGRVRTVPDRILVKYRNAGHIGIQENNRAVIESNFGIRELKYFPFIDVYLYKVHQSRESTLTGLNLNPGIEYAEPDYIRHSHGTFPDDPEFNNLWGLHNTGLLGGQSDADIDAPEAWDITRGSRNVVIGVVDSGLDYNHVDLRDNVWVNPGEIAGNGIDDDGNGYIDDIHGINAITGSGDPMDDDDHGTHTAGTAAASGNNGTGVTGVCWQASIMGLKFLDANGDGSDSDAIECIQYAVNKGAHVLNNSWGGGGNNQSLKAAIEAAGQAGILFVVSAGNDGINIDQEADYPTSFNSKNILSVAASNRSDVLANWSNYGATTVDVCAPGVFIRSTVRDNKYATWQGTSMAAPFVSGLAALIKSQHPGWSWNQIKDHIMSGVEKKPTMNGKVLSGGRINARQSLGARTPVISGWIRTPAGVGVSGVTVTFSNGAGSTRSESNGKYSLNVNSGWSGSARPAREWFRFSPKSLSFSNVNADLKNQNFRALKILPALNFTGKLEHNRSLFQTEYIVILTWAANPANTGIDKYRIYIENDDGRLRLVDLDPSENRYVQRRVLPDNSPTYLLVAVDGDGIEGEPAVWKADFN